jgi:hypothetical protein
MLVIATCQCNIVHHGVKTVIFMEITLQHIQNSNHKSLTDRPNFKYAQLEFTMQEFCLF